MTWTLEQVSDALRASWTRGTADPVDAELWTAGNPSRGQCGASSFVIQDLLGGDLVLAEVFFPDGSRQGVHYWNKLPDGTEVDLTREQFVDGEQVVHPQVVTRVPGPPMLRCVDQYLMLLKSVLTRLPAADVTVADPVPPADPQA